MTNGILTLILIAITVVMIIGLTSFFTKEERKYLKSIKKTHEEAIQTYKKAAKESRATLEEIRKKYEEMIEEITNGKE